MGRGKIEVKRIENKTSRQVTFSKRRTGLLKKTHELSVLCDAQIGLIVFSSKGKLFEYSSSPSSMRQIIERYMQAKGTSILQRDTGMGEVSNYNEQLHTEMKRMKRKTIDLQLSVQRYQGNVDMNSLKLEELVELEHQLEISVNKVRARKFQLLNEQIENLKKTENLLEKENQDMYHWLMNSHIQSQAEAMEHHHLHHQQAMTELRLLEEQPLLNQLQVFGQDLQPSANAIPMLQLGTLPLNNNSYHLQPTHPNLQESGLQGFPYV
ncbi:MADS-box protein defh21 [Olea europaea var. sylvestris]|uniref:MADS-box defh21 n=1 Tax=Olea europaea subsp. europaea TaxID=158383 RepID=A0A8S0UBR3_OLEEU|nr:MADS-box protein defh21 [Olea europaea var. sylvestris]XP_022866191.1 MADS-box protein defh21 [Olea europaea var. sylvestris]CAA3014073.1 MADS-box defh21 [Olea europaea subsp. europaea]